MGTILSAPTSSSTGKYHAIRFPAGWTIYRNGLVNAQSEVAFFDKSDWTQKEIDIILELLNRQGK